MRRRSYGLQTILLLLPLFAPPRVLCQIDQVELGKTLIGGNFAEREAAVATLGSMDPAAFSPLLRLAAVTAVDRDVAVFRRAKIHGTVMGPWSLPSLLTLTKVVANLRDSTVIGSLVVTVGMGGPGVVRALAEFGEPAVEPLVAEIHSSGEREADVIAGLLTLRAIVERRSERPLSERALTSIQGVAMACLTGVQEPGVLWRAIDLAVALDDPNLRTIVQSLASDSAAVVARGVTEPALIESVRRRAADRLAGVPAPPAVR
jgi:hypothetical protein